MEDVDANGLLEVVEGLVEVSVLELEEKVVGTRVDDEGGAGGMYGGGGGGR